MLSASASCLTRRSGGERWRGWEREEKEIRVSERTSVDERVSEEEREQKMGLVDLYTDLERLRTN